MDPTKPVRHSPAYIRIGSELRRRVDTGFWSMGEMIPSRQALAREYGVDVSTVQRAIADLIGDGTLRADRGRGTFVARESLSDSDANIAVLDSVPGVLHHPLVSPNASTSTNSSPAILIPKGGVRPSQSLERFGMLCKLTNPSDFWPRTVIHGLERVIAEAGGATSFVNLAPPFVQPSYCLSPREGARKLFEEGARVLVIIDVRDDWTERNIVDAITGFGGDTSRVAVVSAINLSLPVPSLLIDQQYAGYLAMRHLIERGIHRDVVFLAPYNRAWVRSRWEGVRQALWFAGLSEDGVTLFPPQNTVSVKQPTEVQSDEMTRIVAHDLLSLRQPFSALIGANDGIAHAFATIAQTGFGLEAGRDYALIGFDDDPEARDKGLTSIRPPLEELGREAGALLLRIASGENANIQTRLGSFLVPRSSTYGVLPRPQNI